jgi:hypothetical protein
MATLIASLQPVDASGVPESPDPPSEPSAPWWRRWCTRLAALALGVMAFALALSW